MTTKPLREKILGTIVEKSMLKQRVFDNTFAVFNLLKDTLFEMASEMEDALEGMILNNVVTSNKGNIYLPHVYAQESETAYKIARMTLEVPEYFH